MRRATVIGSVALGASLLLAGAPLAASAADTTLYSPDSLAIVGMPYSVSGLDCVSEGSGPASVSVSFNGTTVSPTVEDDGSWQTDYIPTAADVDTLTVSATCDTSTSSWPYDGYDVEILAAPETPTGSITDVAVDGCTLRASVTTGGRGNAFSAQVAPASGQAWDWAFYEPDTSDIAYDLTLPASLLNPVELSLTGAPASGGDPTPLDSVTYEVPADVADACAAAVPVSLELLDYDGSVAGGETMLVRGEGYLSPEPVAEPVRLTLTGPSGSTVTLATLPIGSKGRAQADGAFRGTLTIPAGTAPGTYTLTSTGTVSGRSAQQEITVVAGGGATRPGLPSSGD